MHSQRITVTTTDRECADTLFRVMSQNGTPVQHDTEGRFVLGYGVPSFTDHAGEKYTVSHTIPCEIGNGPLTNVHNAIARYIPVILEYRSERND